MPDHAHYRDDDIVNPETRHEESDVNVRALLWSVVIFIVFAAVTHAVLYLQFHAYAKHFRNEAVAAADDDGAPVGCSSRPRRACSRSRPRSRRH